MISGFPAKFADLILKKGETFSLNIDQLSSTVPECTVKSIDVSFNGKTCTEQVKYEQS
jgi:hypothetical protein